MSEAAGRGEVFGVLGPNGAGKTTHLELVFLDELTAGLDHRLGMRRGVSCAGSGPAARPSSSPRSSRSSGAKECVCDLKVSEPTLEDLFLKLTGRDLR